jgi:hypothetical protein
MALQLSHREAWVVLPAAEHWALAIGTPADRKQCQILLQVVEPVELLPP